MIIDRKMIQTAFINRVEGLFERQSYVRIGAFEWHGQHRQRLVDLPDPKSSLAGLGPPEAKQIMARGYG